MALQRKLLVVKSIFIVFIRRCAVRVVHLLKLWMCSPLELSWSLPMIATVRSAPFIVYTNRGRGILKIILPSLKPMVINHYIPCCLACTVYLLKYKFAPKIWSNWPITALLRIGCIKPIIKMHRWVVMRVRVNGCKDYLSYNKMLVIH